MLHPAKCSGASILHGRLWPHRPCGPRCPTRMQVHSEHLTGEMRLWDARDHKLLHQPAAASLGLTPALSR